MLRIARQLCQSVLKWSENALFSLLWDCIKESRMTHISQWHSLFALFSLFLWECKYLNMFARRISFSHFSWIHVAWRLYLYCVCVVEISNIVRNLSNYIYYISTMVLFLPVGQTSVCRMRTRSCPMTPVLGSRSKDAAWRDVPPSYYTALYKCYTESVSCIIILFGDNRFAKQFATRNIKLSGNLNIVNLVLVIIDKIHQLGKKLNGVYL